MKTNSFNNSKRRRMALSVGKTRIDIKTDNVKKWY